MKSVYCWLLAISVPLASWAATTSDVMTTFAGGGPNHVAATTANMPYPVSTAVDSSGNYYIVTQSTNPPQNRVFEVNTSGVLTIVGGNGLTGYIGDGGSALNAEFNYPQAIAVSPSGDLYIADTNNCAIRIISKATGAIGSFAGNGACGYFGDGGPAAEAQLNYPSGLAFDRAGNLYIADTANEAVRKVDASTGIITTIAGTGIAGYSGDGRLATLAQLNNPYSVAVDALDNVYIADQLNYRIREVTASTHKITTYAGNGLPGYYGDDVAAPTAELSIVSAIAADSAGNLYIADTENCMVREVNTAAAIHRIAGQAEKCGYSGDGGLATSGWLNEPSGLAVSSSGVVYVADFSNLVIRKFIVGGDISTVAGNGTYYYTPGLAATSASMFASSAVPDALGNVYIADTFNCIVRKVNASGTISTIAGTAPNISGTFCGYSGDSGSAIKAELNDPYKVVPDVLGDIYIADTANCAIRKVTFNGTISTLAGVAGRCGYGGDGGAASGAYLSFPQGLALDVLGNVYIADTGNNVVRQVSALTGRISTIAGKFGGGGYSGDGEPAINAQLNTPYDVGIDLLGNLYIADHDNNRIRIVSAGIINTFAGNGAAGYQSDGVPANATSLNSPAGVAIDVAGDVLVADQDNQRLRWINGQGIIYSVAGSGIGNYSGDDALATTLDLADPSGVAVDPAGNMFVADLGNYRIRKITSIPNLNSSAYALSFGDEPTGRESAPQQLTITGVGEVTISKISITGDFKQTNACASSLGSGGACKISVTFAPTGTGNRAGALTITTNSFFANNIAITLSGTGISAR